VTPRPGTRSVSSAEPSASAAARRSGRAAISPRRSAAAPLRAPTAIAIGSMRCFTSTRMRPTPAW
jgi:hypothetical protein